MAKVCRFYLRGNCKFGEKCRYRHPHDVRYKYRHDMRYKHRPAVARFKQHGHVRTAGSYLIASQQRTSPRSEPIGGQWYSVPLPKGLPIGLVAGTGLHKLYPIEEGLKPRVVRIRPSDSEVSFQGADTGFPKRPRYSGGGGGGGGVLGEVPYMKGGGGGCNTHPPTHPPPPPPPLLYPPLVLSFLPYCREGAGLLS